MDLHLQGVSIHHHMAHLPHVDHLPLPGGQYRIPVFHHSHPAGHHLHHEDHQHHTVLHREGPVIDERTELQREGLLSMNRGVDRQQNDQGQMVPLEEVLLSDVELYDQELSLYFFYSCLLGLL